jgi:transcriptional regulator with XRE-family HTH domain
VRRLEQLRLDALLTPEALSQDTGVSPRTIRRLEKDGHGAQVATLGKLAARFDVKPSELLRDVDAGVAASPFEGRGVRPAGKAKAA